MCGGPSGTPAFSEYDTPLVEDTDLTEATAILRESFGGFKPSATAGDVAIDVHLKPFIAPVGTDLGIIKFVMKSANCEDAVVPVRFKVMAKTQRTLSVSIENWTYGSTPSQPVYGAPAARRAALTSLIPPATARQATARPPRRMRATTP